MDTVTRSAPLALPENAREFTVTTTRRTVQVIATSTEEATAIFSGQRWPLHIPPAPQPAQEQYRTEQGWLDERPTAAWNAWWAAYRDDLWSRLDRTGGECMLKVNETSLDS